MSRIYVWCQSCMDYHDPEQDDCPADQMGGLDPASRDN